ncbi:MAG: carboxypeptidase-like regulatory domain-containing protein [Bacteroidales bacterium]|nr:carboxypeptidase-like regulatory domain-containing protein [Bacteroidales bacterium]
MKKLSGLWILLLIFLPIFLQGQGISIYRINDKALSTDPGKIITFAYRIINHESTSLSLTPSLILPESWTQIVQPEKILLKSSDSLIRLVSCAIPPLTKAGDYTLSYQLTDEQGKSYSSDATVRVNKKTGLLIDLVESQPYVKAGEDVHSRYVVRNKSNIPHNITITTVNGQVQGPVSFDLQPDSSRIIEIVSPTIDAITENTTNGYRVRASVTGNEEGAVESYHQVNVIPVIEPEIDLYHRFPVTASLTYLTRYRDEAFTSGFQGELYGIGTLDPKGKHQLEFRLRGPNRFNLSVLGQYDEYFATYRNKNLEATIGDRNYSLTPLTENSRYGRGVAAALKNRRMEIGGFYNKPRFLPEVTDVYAGYFNFLFSDKNKIGVVYLHKKYSESVKPADIFSLTTSLEPFKYSKLYVEVSRGTQGDKSGYGAHLGFDFRTNKLSFSSFAIYAGKDYPGYYTNTTTYSGNLSYQVLKKLSILANARHDDRNASRDTLYGVSPIRQDIRAGLGYSFGTSGTLRGYAGYISSEDRAVSKQFHYDEKYLRLEYIQMLNKFNLDFYSDLGTTTNYLLADHQEARSFRAQAHLGYRPSDKFSVGGFAAFSRDNRYSRQVENTWYYGMDMTAWLSKTTYASFRFQNNYSIEEYYRDRSLMDFRFSQRFLRNHEITLMSQYALVQKYTDESDLSVRVTYSYRIGVPLKRVAEPGSTVSGQVDNLGTTSVKGIILQLNGYTTSTDENGFFVFYNIKPGIYYLTIDKTSIQLTEIPDVQIPMTVVVEQDKDNFVRFGLTTAATVKGKLEFNGNSGASASLSSSGQDPARSNHVIIEMKMGEELIRKVTDPFGTFEFTYMRPGIWTMKIYANGLSKDYQLEQSEYQLDLKPGDRLDIPVVLKKKERVIKFVDQPGIISYKK